MRLKDKVGKLEERVEELELALEQSEKRSSEYKSSIISIFNKALGGYNMGDYTNKGLMCIMSEEIIRVEGRLSNADIKKMFN